MPSSHYQKLQAHIEELRRDLLPLPFVDTGIYDDVSRINTRTVAFVTLVHAELEAYFETRAAEVANAAKDSFLSAQAHVCRVIVCLLGFQPGSGQAPGVKLSAAGNGESELGAWKEETDIKSRVKAAADAYLSFVYSKNNGIKEENLAAILLPIGFRYFGFDTFLITRLNELGKARGGFVHRSKDKHLIEPLDPKTRYDQLKRLIDDIHTMDKEFDNLLSSTVPPAQAAA